MTRQYRPALAAARSGGNVARTDEAILITPDDHRRILARAGRAAADGAGDAERLIADLSDAVIVDPDRFPDDVARLDAFVTYASRGRERSRALIFPEDAVWPDAELSVFSALGRALLGRRVGATVRTTDDVTAGHDVRIHGVGPDLQFGLARRRCA